jgi:hypothetical protein
VLDTRSLRCQSGSVVAPAQNLIRHVVTSAGNITYKHLITFRSHLSTNGSGVVDRTRTTPTQGLDL